MVRGGSRIPGFPGFSVKGAPALKLNVRLTYVRFSLMYDVSRCDLGVGRWGRDSCSTILYQPAHPQVYIVHRVIRGNKKVRLASPRIH